MNESGCHCGCNCEKSTSAATSVESAEKNRATVLVVDDDPDFLIQQRHYLEAAGYQVVAAEGETEAEKVLTEVTPDLVVVDLMMEQADGGFSLSHAIRKQHPTMPIIMVSSVNNETGLGFETSSEGAKSWIKADVLLSKPIRFEQLQHEIDRLLGKG